MRGQTVLAVVGVLLMAAAAGCSSGGGGGGGGGSGPPANQNVNDNLIDILSNDNDTDTDTDDETVLDLGNGVTLTLVAIPAGSFVMGSPPDEAGRLPNEAPQRTVQLSAFHMAETPVTAAQWRRFTEETGYAWLATDQELAVVAPGDDYPVALITHADAVAFCDWVEDRTGRNAKLPTEAQWEYACRAGTATAFSFGDAAPQDHMNFEGTGGLDQFDQSAPVRAFAPNGWGLYDMHGNVWERCRDRYDADFYVGRPDPDVDPQGPESGTQHVLRGGGWASDLSLCRSATRGGDSPLIEGGRFGFRIVVEGE